MPTAVGELNRILRDFNAKYKASLSAIVSRSGVPIAWAVPPEMRVDNLATDQRFTLQETDGDRVTVVLGLQKLHDVVGVRTRRVGSRLVHTRPAPLSDPSFQSPRANARQAESAHPGPPVRCANVD